MADLEFKHHVDAIAAGGDLPTYNRSESVQVTTTPDLQGAVSNYAENSNWMSQVGSTVATSAANATAKKLGSELGKNPRGDIILPLTNFDKTLNESYRTQAQSTLGLQANKLITDSNVEMARAPRITPELIARTNRQVSIGLQNIFQNAPSEVRPHMEYQYGSQQINQTAELSERMFREQRQDQKANTANATLVNGENAYALALNGNFEAGLKAVEATRQANESDVAVRISDPAYAKNQVDSVRQSFLSGKYIHGYEKARKEGKGEEYLRNLADKKPEDVSPADYATVVSHTMSYVNQQATLRHQDQALAMAKFNVSLAEDPTGITGSQISELNSHLDPIQQQEASLAYVKAIKSIQKKNDGIAEALAGYTDINKFPQQSTENKNGAWESTYKAIQERPEYVAQGITEDTAKLYAAAAAPVAIPAYITELKAKASSSNPIDLESAGQSVNYMRSNNMGEKLAGLGEAQEAMLETYSQLRQTMDPVEAAQKSHEVVYNKSKEQKDANKDALAEYYKQQQKTSKLSSSFGLVGKLIGGTENLVVRNLPGYSQKANKIFENYFNLTNGDESTALKLTKQYMNTQYGPSTVNGDNELMFHPVENIPGIPHDAIGPIQTDIVEQANHKFQNDKKLFDENKLDHWYEARQRISAEEALTSRRIVDSINEGYSKHPITGQLFDVHSVRKDYNDHSKILETYNKGQAITIIKHNRSGKEEVFEGAIQANPWGVSTGRPDQPIAGGWDLMLKTEHGTKSIPMMNPLNSSIQYNPRVGYIKKLYTHTVGMSTLQFKFINAPKGSLANTLANK